MTSTAVRSITARSNADAQLSTMLVRLCQDFADVPVRDVFRSVGASRAALREAEIDADDVRILDACARLCLSLKAAPRSPDALAVRAA